MKSITASAILLAVVCISLHVQHSEGQMGGMMSPKVMGKMAVGVLAKLKDEPCKYFTSECLTCVHKMAKSFVDGKVDASNPTSAAMKMMEMAKSKECGCSALLGVVTQAAMSSMG